MSSKYEYAILNKNAILTDLNRGESLNNQRSALVGQIVKVESVLAKSNFGVRYLNEGETWDRSTYCCLGDNLTPIDEKLWQFLASVPSPQERLKLAKNKVRCEKLLQISKEMIVGYSTDNDVHLGHVRYIGIVKGIGKCFGLQLHNKLPNSKCNGSHAGIQYFSCLPGFGVFTTIETLMPQNCYSPETRQPKQCQSTDLDVSVEKNISHFSANHRENVYSTRSTLPAKNSSYFKTSHSMQNIYETNSGLSINTNNDFDDNSILQPDKTYLLKESRNVSQAKITLNHKNKSEVDLKDVIGDMWSDVNETVQPNSYSHLRGVSEKYEQNNTGSSASDRHSSPVYNNGVTKVRNKSGNPLSHIVNGSKTLPKKNKFLQDRIVNKEKNLFVSTKNIEISPKLADRAEKAENSNHQLSVPSTSQPQKNEITIYYDPEPGMTNDLSVGTLVEVSNDVSEVPMYGVIRWMGCEAKTKFVLVGVELDTEQTHLPLTLTDGQHNGLRFFECSSNRALFVPISQCHKDSRFVDGTPTPVHSVTEKTFGKDCPIIQGSVAPLSMPTEEDVEAVCGKFRGIQGHHNSCYLDATLFAMFTYTGVFDSLLYRPKGPNDIPHYDEVQRVLREEIVNPLRKELFVRADRVMNLRKLLDQLSSVSGLTSEEKDPEEFLNSLLAQILKAEPFLKLNSGQEAYYYQLFVEKDDDLELPNVQQLFEQSFNTSDIKLKEVPSCLIIQMPRFGKSYKMYPRILPSQLLDVTDIIENSPRQCTVCGQLAIWECRECFGMHGFGLDSTAYCRPCLETAHSHHSRKLGHHPRPLVVSHDFSIMAEHCPPPRLFMELFAVICIETSHYVAFVKCGAGHGAPWCFFDSMADRKGERNGYNIPEMVACPDVSKWLADDQMCRLMHESSPQDRHLPEHARRLLCDAYICMYQSPDVMMYR